MTSVLVLFFCHLTRKKNAFFSFYKHEYKSIINLITKYCRSAYLASKRPQLNLLTYSSDHQELPEEQQHVGYFIEHHDPANQRNAMFTAATHAGIFMPWTGRHSFGVYGSCSTNLIIFLMSSLKAFLAETQKFFP